MIHIIDYGLGNIKALLTSFERMGIDVVRAQSSNDLIGAEKLILPGVGAFDYAMNQLNRSGMRDDLDYLVLDQKKPVLGICVGMQMMAESSEEGDSNGLAWIPGCVRNFRSNQKFSNYPLPHMGWNDVSLTRPCPLFDGIKSDARFYFLHSYYYQVESNDNSTAISEYGGEFTCAISAGNIYGVQFHPEKSHNFGALILKNFASL